MIITPESMLITKHSNTEFISHLNWKLVNCFELTSVLSKKCYTTTFFSFNVVKPMNWTFTAGSAALIGLIANGRFIYNLYFICSPTWSNVLEFYLARSSTNGLSTFLRTLTARNSILIKAKTFETLNFKSLSPGSRLYLLCSGAGIAPLVSILLEPEVYNLYKQVIIVSVCRYVNEFALLNEKLNQLKQNRRLMALAKGKARFYTSTTRERSQFMGRIPHLITSGTLTTALGGLPFNAADRFMLCGARAMVTAVTKVLSALGYKKGTKTNPQSFVCANISVD
ncbi:MAG: hypothetical protein ACTS6G_00040 [Candidatus Hodgkinia cicadicola]